MKKKKHNQNKTLRGQDFQGFGIREGSVWNDTSLKFSEFRSRY